MKILLVTLLIGTLIFGASTLYALSEREALASELLELTKDVSCDTDTQCKSFGYGNRPCGGYAAYKPYSTKTVSEATFLPKAKHYAVLDKIYNQTQSMGSICSIEMPLKMACVNNQCVEMRE